MGEKLKLNNIITLPEITVTPNNVLLHTYRPIVDSRYKLTGHSLLISLPKTYVDIPSKNGLTKAKAIDAINISNTSNNPNYNLVTNNCSDATKEALESISRKKLNSFLFTTPGDVREFAEKELDGITKYINGHYITTIPINQIQRLLLAKISKRKPKHQFGGFLNFLKNSMQTAAIAESPAVMTASGYKTHPNGTVTFNHQNDKGVKLLRNNLVDIGEAAITAPTAVEGIEGLATIIRHPIRTGKTLVKGVGEGIKRVKRLVRRPQSNKLFTTNYKDGSLQQRDLEWLKQYFAQEKIKGNNYGITDGEVQQGLPNHVLTYLNQNTVERNARAMRKNGYSDREILMYKDKVNEEMRNVRVGKYSNKDYKAAGCDDFGGFYDNNNNFISINMEGAFEPDYVMKHEGRHLIDYHTDMTDDLREYIKKAYDDDFLNLPKYDETGKLKGYKHMDREGVTTNRDARDWFLNNLSSVDLLNPNELHKYPFWNKLDMLSFQNQLIDLANDDKIILAVEEANGYGSKYIKYLRKNNKLTPQKILQFRDAMKNVGSYMIPVTTGLTLKNK